MSESAENALKLLALLALLWTAAFFVFPELIGWELKRMDNARYQDVIDQ